MEHVLIEAIQESKKLDGLRCGSKSFGEITRSLAGRLAVWLQTREESLASSTESLGGCSGEGSEPRPGHSPVSHGTMVNSGEH